MKILLAAVNAKYIHSNLAVYCLRAYAKEQHPASNITISEYTINQPFDEILMDIYKQAPDVLCLSCYLWNVTEVGQLIQEIPKILPDTKIWLGGPEVSYNAREVLEKYPMTEGIMRGEGEETFAELVAYYEGRGAAQLINIQGITFREEEKQIAGILRISRTVSFIMRRAEAVRFLVVIVFLQLINVFDSVIWNL